MSEVLSGRVSKNRRDRRIKNGTVLRMMAIMQEGNSEVPKEFLETGRTGRRNAMPDILHPQGVEVTTADLPSRLQQLVTNDVVTVGQSSDMGVQKPQERPEQSQPES